MFPLLHLLASLLFSTPIAPVTVIVNSTAVQEGDFYIAVYASAADFEAEKMTIAEVKKAANGTAFALKLPQRGKYIVSAYHDVNGNGKLDYNFLGVPKEPYGFVVPPSSKYEKPAFSEVSSELTGGEQKELQLKYWREF